MPPKEKLIAEGASNTNDSSPHLQITEKSVATTQDCQPPRRQIRPHLQITEKSVATTQDCQTLRRQTQAPEKKPQPKRVRRVSLPGRAQPKKKTERPFIDAAQLQLYLKEKEQDLEKENQQTAHKMAKDNDQYWVAVEAIAHPKSKKGSSGKKARRFQMLNCRPEVQDPDCRTSSNSALCSDSTLFSIHIG